MKRFLAAAAVALACGAAHADTLKADSLACVTRGRLEELRTAVDRRDDAALGHMPGCFAFKRPVEASRLDCGWAVCKVRVYGPAGSAVVYTTRDSFRH